MLSSWTVSANENMSFLSLAFQTPWISSIRRFEEAVNAGNVEEATQRFQFAQKKISQVASKGTIHKNAAARKVAKLAQKLNSMNA